MTVHASVSLPTTVVDTARACRLDLPRTVVHMDTGSAAIAADAAVSKDSNDSQVAAEIAHPGCGYQATQKCKDSGTGRPGEVDLGGDVKDTQLVKAPADAANVGLNSRRFESGSKAFCALLRCPARTHDVLDTLPLFMSLPCHPLRSVPQSAMNTCGRLSGPKAPGGGGPPLPLKAMKEAGSGAGLGESLIFAVLADAVPQPIVPTS